MNESEQANSSLEAESATFRNERFENALKEAETLRDATKILVSTLDIDEVLNLILSQLNREVPFDSATVQQLGDTELEITACYGFEDAKDVVGLRSPLEARLPNMRVISSDDPILVEDMMTKHPDFGQGTDAFQSGFIRSWLGVPLLVRDKKLGMIAMDRHEV